MSGEPGDLTDIVLEEVRNLCAQYSTTSPFPVKPLPSSRGASSSSSSTGLRQPLREYRTRPSASRSGSASGHHEPRKRPFDHEGEGGGDAKRGAPMTTTVTTPVLRYSLSNVTYRVDLEALSNVFSQYGRVVKLTTFPDQGTLSGYVQFENVPTAQMTVNKLQGRNIYHGCCRLNLMATDIPDLTIGKEDEGDHARDFSSPRNRNRRPSHGDDGQGRGEGGGGGGGERGKRFSGDVGSPMTRRVPEKLDAGGGRGRGGGRGGILPSPSFRPFVDYGRDNGSSPMGVVPDGRNGGFGGYGGDRGNGGLPPVQTLWPSAGRGGGRGGRARGDMSWESPAWQVPQARTVLFVANLNETKVTAERLFMIFGVYCDVMKVKIFYREKSKAIIQAIDEYQADTARNFLDGVELWGRVLSVTFAGPQYQEIQIRPNGDETWAKDFSLTAFWAHRFRGNFGQKHLQNVTTPIPTLYVSNVPKSATEEELKKFFEDSLKDDDDKKKSDEVPDPEDDSSSTTSSASSKVLRVQFFSNSTGMAFVEMADVDAAFDAVVNVHNRRLDGVTRGKPLFVNFSKVHLDDFNKTGWSTFFRGQ